MHQGPGLPAESPEKEAEDRGRLVDLVLKRCEENGIPSFKEQGVVGPRVEIELPAGRDRRLLFGNAERLAALLDIEFEKYVALGQFAAVASYGDGIIEALVESPGQGFPVRPILERAGSESDPLLNVSQGGVQISLGDASRDLEILVGRGSLSRARTRLALRISGLTLSGYDYAVGRLEVMANSFFMELDSAFGVPLVLSRVRRPRTVRRVGRSNLEDVRFPSSEYDSQPMSLYWYGRGATGMPLLRFLSFYQVLEFYFPVYAEQEIRRRVKGVVKDPSFQPHRETDISKIMRALSSGGRRSFGDERAQLRATIRSCADPDDVRDYLSVSDRRAQYFERKKKDPTTPKPIRREMDDTDLLDATAERVYEIRCRIVHTKDSDGEVGQLLPFSPEAEQMDQDIGLVEMLAQSVLVTGSRELSF